MKKETKTKLVKMNEQLNFNFSIFWRSVQTEIAFILRPANLIELSLNSKCFPFVQTIRMESTENLTHDGVFNVVAS